MTSKAAAKCQFRERIVFLAPFTTGKKTKSLLTG